MKNLYVRLVVALAAAFALVSITGCEKDPGDKPVVPPVTVSPIIGAYAPVIENGVGACTVKAVWNDATDVPVIDLTELGMGPVGCDMLLDLLNPMLGKAYSDALVRFEFRKDGSISMTDRDGDGVTSTFPDGSVEDATIASMISYSTPLNKNEGQFFLILKRALFDLVKGDGSVDINKLLDAMVAEYPNLGLEVTAEAVWIPIKYKLDGDVLTFWVDREMMMPYIPVLSAYVLPKLPETIMIGEAPFSLKKVVSSALSSVISKSSDLRIEVKMKRISE